MVTISSLRYTRAEDVLKDASDDVTFARGGLGEPSRGRSVADCRISAENDLNYLDVYLSKMIVDATGADKSLSFADLRKAIADRASKKDADVVAKEENADAVAIQKLLCKRDELLAGINVLDASFVPKIEKAPVEKAEPVSVKIEKVVKEKPLPLLTVLGDWYYNWNSTKKKLGISLKGFVFSSWDNTGKLMRQVLEPLVENPRPDKTDVVVAVNINNLPVEHTYTYNPASDVYTRRIGETNNVVSVTRNAPDEISDFSRLDMLRMQKEPFFKSWRDMFRIRSLADALREARAARQRGDFSLDWQPERRRIPPPGLVQRI